MSWTNLFVDLVDGIKVLHSLEEDVDLDEVLVGSASSLKDNPDILDALGL